MSKKNQQVAFGIDELVAKLQTEGVEEAQKQSAKLLADAEQQAKAILAKAQYQRDQLLAKARQQINTERQAAQDDLKISYRDMVLDLKNHLLSRFAQDVERLVSQSLQSEQLIKKLVFTSQYFKKCVSL